MAKYTILLCTVITSWKRDTLLNISLESHIPYVSLAGDSHLVQMDTCSYTKRDCHCKGQLIIQFTVLQQVSSWKYPRKPPSLQKAIPSNMQCIQQPEGLLQLLLSHFLAKQASYQMQYNSKRADNTIRTIINLEITTATQQLMFLYTCWAHINAFLQKETARVVE